MFKRLAVLFVKCLPTWFVQKLYVRAGAIFGDMLSYIYLGKPEGFDRAFEAWAYWEAEYSRRGYRTFTIDDFIDCGGYGRPLEGLGEKRQPNEKSILYAAMHREEISDIPKSTGVIEATMQRKFVIGQYELPTSYKEE